MTRSTEHQKISQPIIAAVTEFHHMVAFIRFAAARHMCFVQMNNSRAAVILPSDQ
jgi:hypothetical protein